MNIKNPVWSFVKYFLPFVILILVALWWVLTYSGDYGLTWLIVFSVSPMIGMAMGSVIAIIWYRFFHISKWMVAALLILGSLLLLLGTLEEGLIGGYRNGNERTQAIISKQANGYTVIPITKTSQAALSADKHRLILSDSKKIGLDANLLDKDFPFYFNRTFFQKKQLPNIKTAIYTTDTEDKLLTITTVNDQELTQQWHLIVIPDPDFAGYYIWQLEPAAN